MSGKLKKAPKKPVGTKWAKAQSPANTTKQGTDTTAERSSKSSFDRKYNNNSKNGGKPYNKPKNGSGMNKGKKPFPKRPQRPAVPNGPEDASSKFLQKIADYITKYCEEHFQEDDKKVKFKVTVNTKSEKYGFVTMKLHMMDEKVEVRYKDLLFTAYADKKRTHVAVAIMNDVNDGFAPIYTGYGKYDDIYKLLEENFLPGISESTYKKLQAIKARFKKK